MIPRRSSRSRWTWARRTSAGVFFSLLVLVGLDCFPWFKGSLTAAEWFRIVPVVDPLAAVEVSLATRILNEKLVLGAALLVGFCLLAGPIFCSWACPLGLVFDLNDALRRRLGRRFPGLLSRDDPRKRSSPRTRYVVLGLVVGFSAVARWPLFLTFSPINLLVRAILFAAAPGLLVVGLLLALEYFAPRAWCRSVCPLGALHGLVGRFAPLRVRVRSEVSGTSHCQSCTRSCPMGIPVMEDYPQAGKSSVDHPDCTRCGACVDVCPGGVLYLGFREVKVPAGSGTDRP